jgi:hypothetical protein
MSALAASVQQARAQPPAPVLASPRLLQRKCACGGSAGVSGRCDECGKRRLSRRVAGLAVSGTAPAIVHDVLRAPGQALDDATRDRMESGFGHDFSRVRIHSDARAADSAAAVDALAYTVGSDIVFAARQYAPTTPGGRKLLAHELAHVVQQADAASAGGPLRIGAPDGPEEGNADRAAEAALAGHPAATEPQARRAARRMLARRVVGSRVHCTGGTDGAPADPVADLTPIVDRADRLAFAASLLLTLESAMMAAGMRAAGSNIENAFNDRFGLPVAAGGGFMNRLTGQVRPTMEAAWSEEMQLMATRYELISGMLERGAVHYLCMSTARSFGGCNITDCSSDAWACPGVNAIFLCPGFWTGGAAGTSATLLIHETAHMMWANVGHGARGSGGNFRHAECYASFIADLFGIQPGGPPCPTT